MGKKLDLVGMKFSRLFVISKSGSNKHKKMTYLCMCDCGNEINAVGSSLVSGNTNSCGCYRNEKSSEAVRKSCTTHGLSKHPLFTVWIDIKRRCFNVNNLAYYRYGGRGVSVCDEWVNDFKAFYDWCINNGWKSGLEIDRYPDNDGWYSPVNCRIATRKENCNNKGNNVLLEIGGIIKTASEWSDIYGKNKSCISKRIKSGVTGLEAVIGVGSGNIFTKNKS